MRTIARRTLPDKHPRKSWNVVKFATEKLWQQGWEPEQKKADAKEKRKSS